jgi:hypothetical protein
VGHDDNEATVITGRADTILEPPAAVKWWGEQITQKITRVPTVLECDGVPVVAGTLLTFTGEGDGRVVEVMDEVPDAAGNVVVREVYRVGADQIGCQIRPARIVLKMTRQEIDEALRHVRGLPAAAALVVRDLTEVIVTGG